MRILYVVNGFDPGGAEHGFLTLVENGAFEGHDLRVLALCRGRGHLADEIGARLGKRVQFVTKGDTLTLWACSAGFFSILQQPGAWLLPRARTFVPWSLPTWGIVPCALLQLMVIGAILWLLLRRADRFERLNGVLLLALPIGVLALNVWLATPLSGLLIVLLWAIFALYTLAQADFRRAYRIERATDEGGG